MPEFPPAIMLHGGPYDGKDAEQLSRYSNPAVGVIFLPHEVRIVGPDGNAVYLLHDSKQGKVGEFDHLG